MIASNLVLKRKLGLSSSFDPLKGKREHLFGDISSQECVCMCVHYFFKKRK